LGTSGGDVEAESGLAAAFITAPSADAAEKLARGVLEKKLAACVSMVSGVRSLFWWEGKLDRADEVMLICKTRMELADELSAYVCENHDYEVPEVIVLPIIGGNPEYLKWVKDSTVE